MRHSLAVALVALVAGLVVGAGCGQKRGQKSADDARGDVQKLVELSKKDVEEIERGLPAGSKKLTDLLVKELGKDGDPTKNSAGVRSALLRMRQQVPDLGIAKSTFFALADPKGVGIRNDFEKDTMGGKDFLAGWPGLRPVTEGAPFVSTVGQFAPTDREWVAAVPVKKPDGSGDGTMGMLVTGWTYRRFAYHLQVTLQRDLQDELMRSQDKGKMPILYVCLFDKDGVYGAASPGAQPVPDTDEKALAQVGLFAKTAAGPAASPLQITDREFGWAAARLPKLSPDVGVVVLRSDL
jgi:hypothetical protein